MMRALSVAATVVVASFVTAPAASAQGAAKVGYKRGFYIASPDDLYRLTIGARVQTRFTFDMDDSSEGYAFSIPRARLALKGNVFSKDLGYKFQADFGKGFVSLKDFYVDYRAVKGWLHVRAGQFKKPFSRQQMTSSGKLALVDRASTDKAFGAGRDIGVMLHNKANTFEYAVGVFNGSGDKARFTGSADLIDGDVSGTFSNVPDTFNPMAVVRLGYNHGAVKGYSEADLEGGDVRFAVATSVKIDGGLDTVGDKGHLGAELDVILKIAGFSLSAAAYLDMPLAEGSLQVFGAHAEAGYVINGMYGVTLRYARVDEMEPGGASMQEIGGGLSLYAFGHKMKWQTDAYGLIDSTPGGPGQTSYLVRTQLQLGF